MSNIKSVEIKNLSLVFDLNGESTGYMHFYVDGEHQITCGPYSTAPNNNQILSIVSKV